MPLPHFILIALTQYGSVLGCIYLHKCMPTRDFTNVNELIFESPPYLTVPHSSHSACTVLPLITIRLKKFFVLWHRHQPTIHHISTAKALTLIK